MNQSMDTPSNHSTIYSAINQSINQSINPAYEKPLAAVRNPMREPMAALSEISRGQCHYTLTMKNELPDTQRLCVCWPKIFFLVRAICNSRGTTPVQLHKYHCCCYRQSFIHSLYSIITINSYHHEQSRSRCRTGVG